MSKPVVNGPDPDGWSVRIGDEAARLIHRSWMIRRAGGASGLLFVILEIVFEFANFYKPGIIGSAVFLPIGMFGLFYAIRLMAQARRIVAARLGMPASDARWVRLRFGPAGFDRWLAARNQPDWPKARTP